MKKKAKSKATGKRTAKKKGGTKKKKELNPAEVRKQVCRIIEARAKKMTEAVAGQAESGQVGPAKFLFEVAHIHPPVEDGSEITKREESLAETLLDRLGIPKTPIAADEYAKDEITVIPANAMSQDDSDEEDDEELEDMESKLVGAETGTKA